MLVAAAVGAVAVLSVFLLHQWREGQRSRASEGAPERPAAVASPVKPPVRLQPRLAWMTGDLPAVRVSGVVLSQGAPQPGATVELHGWTTAAGARGVDRVTTDAEGRFDLGFQDPAMSVVLARHDDEAASQRIDLADPTMMRGAEKIVLELRPCTRRISGRLVDDARQPLAELNLFSVVNVSELALVQIGRSAADGRFSVCAPGGVAAGGAPWGLAMLPQLEEVGDVVLVPTMTVRGRVTEAGGAPIAGALVWAIGNASLSAFMWGQPASTDEDGAYELRIGPGCYDMLAVHRGRSEYRGELFCGSPGEDIEAPTISLDSCALSVDGIVRIPNEPARGLRVRIGRLIDITDLDGRFSFPCAFAGTLTIDGHIVEPAIDLEGKSGAVQIEVEAIPGARIHGQVTSAGLPVVNARVEAVEERAAGNTTVLRPPQPWAWSRSDGSYQLLVAPGRHRLRASDRDSRRAESRWIDVPRHAGDIRIDLELDRGDTLHGVAHQESGKPAAGVWLTLRPRPAAGVVDLIAGGVKPGSPVSQLDIGALTSAMERTRLATTGADGRFGFGEVEAGAYLIDPGHGPWRLADNRSSVEVDVRAGEDNEVELVFSDRAGLALRGRVVASDGRPTRYARVSLDLLDQVLVNPEGEFAFDDLAPGDYELKASSADGSLTCRSGKVSAGGPPVTLTIRPPRLTGRGRTTHARCEER